MPLFRQELAIDLGTAKLLQDLQTFHYICTSIQPITDIIESKKNKQ